MRCYPSQRNTAPTIDSTNVSWSEAGCRGQRHYPNFLEVWHQIGYDNDFLVVVCHGMMPPLGQGVGGPPDSLTLSAAAEPDGIVSHSTREFDVAGACRIPSATCRQLISSTPP